MNREIDDEPDFGQTRTSLSWLNPDHVSPTNTEAQEHTLWRRQVRAAEQQERDEMAWELGQEGREEWGGRWG